MITESKIKSVAAELGIEEAVIKAVAEVESSGGGFLNGEPKILFEPHKYWQNLKDHGIDPNKHTDGNEDILYPKWGSKSYGKSSAQHTRLDRAAKINREAALESASWGMFQVMGELWKSLGYSSLQEFINEAYKDEDAHFEMFMRYIKVNNLVKHLKAKNWSAFALGYNGKNYKVNKYDSKLAKAYEKYKD